MTRWLPNHLSRHSCKPTIWGRVPKWLAKVPMISLHSPKPLSSLAFLARNTTLVVLVTLVVSCGESAPPGPPPAPPVTVATPVKRTIFDFDEYVGRFVAVDSVEVRARDSGY